MQKYKLCFRLILGIFTSRHLLNIPVWQEAILRVSVGRVGDIFVGIPGEQVHHSMTVFSNYTLHKRQEIAAKVHAYCRLPAVVLVLDEMGDLRNVKGLHGNNDTFLISETCHHSRDSREKRLGPPLKEFEPVEVAALFGGADLCRGLQLHVTGRSSRGLGIFIPTVYLAGEQQSVIREPSLHHSAEGLVGVNHSTRVR